MNISETCIRRPVLTTLMTASLIVFGVFAYRLLPVAALPAVDFPTIQITATLPGRERRRRWRFGRLADRAAALDDLRHLVDDVVVLARLDADHHPVRSRPQHRRRRARRADRACDRAAPAAGRNDDAAVLPQGQSGRLPGALRQSCAPTPCRCRRSTITPRPCWRRQISQLPGVAQVLVYGAQKFAVRVQVDPVAAAARNISLDDIRSVVAKANSIDAGRHAAGQRSRA